MKVLDLFSGIGGFSLGLERTGMETVAFCEFDKKAQLVLKKHWPDVPIYNDVRELTYDKLKEDGIISDTELINGRRGPVVEPTRNEGWGKSEAGRKSLQSEYRETRSNDIEQVCKNGLPSRGEKQASTVDLICGGFPCQPFSVAGQQRGEEDDRHLWPEYFRLVQEIRPRWVLCENVTGLINLGLDQVLSDLASEIYSCQTLIIPACAVNAPHRRDRVWVVANSRHRAGWDGERGISGGDGARRFQKGIRMPETVEVAGSSKAPKVVANTAGKGWERRLHRGQNPQRESQQGLSGCGSTVRIKQEQNWWAVEPDVGRVAHGIPNRVDRLKQLGNAVVPSVVEQIGRAIMEIEESECDLSR